MYHYLSSSATVDLVWHRIWEELSGTPSLNGQLPFPNVLPLYSNKWKGRRNAWLSYFFRSWRCTVQSNRTLCGKMVGTWRWVAVLWAISLQNPHLNLTDLLNFVALRIQYFVLIFAVVAATPLCRCWWWLSRYQRWDPMITRKKCRVPSIVRYDCLVKSPSNSITTPCSSVKGLRFLNSPCFVRLCKGFWASFIQNLSASASSLGVRGPSLWCWPNFLSRIFSSSLLIVQSHVLISSNLRTLMDRWLI